MDKLILTILLFVGALFGLLKSEDVNKKEEEQIAIERENINYENGYLYENDTLLIVFKEKVEIANKYNAQITMPMYDIGMCNFKFNIKMNLSELQQLLDNIKLEDKIEDVHINYVTQIGYDKN